MKTITGKDKIVFIENIDGTFNDEFVIDDKTTVITSSDKAHGFNTQSELQTYIASIDVAKFPTIPSIGGKCEANKIYAYGKDKVKCIQSHQRTTHTPESTPALWLMIPSTSSYPVWKQPAGAHDAYQIYDRVYFPTAKDSVYESKINANVWSPTAYPAGWKKI